MSMGRGVFRRHFTASAAAGAFIAVAPTLIMPCLAWAQGLAPSSGSVFVWSGVASGVWGEPANWTCGGTNGVPDGATVTASFASDARVTIGGDVRACVFQSLAFGKGADVAFRGETLDASAAVSDEPLIGPVGGTLTLADTTVRLATKHKGRRFFAGADGRLVLSGRTVVFGDIFNSAKGGTGMAVVVTNGEVRVRGEAYFGNMADGGRLDVADATLAVDRMFQVARCAGRGPTLAFARGRLTAGGFVATTPFAFQFALPEKGLDAAPVCITGAAELVCPVTFRIDARTCAANGAYPLIKSGGLRLLRPDEPNFGYVLEATCAPGMTARLALSRDGRGIDVVLSGGIGDAEPETFGIRHPRDGETAVLLTDNQLDFLNLSLADLRRATGTWHKKHVATREEIESRIYLDTTPQPLMLTWRGTTGESRVCVRRASDGKMVFERTVNGTSVGVFNLELGTRYEWTLENAGHKETATFVTDGRPIRIVDGQGIGEKGAGRANMRDLGGWKGLDGRRVRQGLLYRSAAPNNAVCTTFCTNTAVFTEVLGIRSELDLRIHRPDSPRNETPGVSGYGESVTWIGCNIPQYTFPDKGDISGVITGEWLPAVFHCIAGKDRTGAYAMTVLALLGVSEADIWRDYTFTHGDYLTERGTVTGELLNGTRFATMFSVTNGYPGCTLAEAMKRYMVEHNGFTDEQIESFRERMLEPLVLSGVGTSTDSK